MNDCIEIHDSTLHDITTVSGDLVLRLMPAYIHRSAGRPGLDPGSGWLQDVEVVLSDAEVEALPEVLPTWLSDGSLSIDGTAWDNEIPVPFTSPGRVKFSAQTDHNEYLVVRASRIKVTPIDEATYLEEFSGLADEAVEPPPAEIPR